MKPLARKDDLVIQEVGGEILIYDLRTNKAICLNQTSALVWQNCDGKKDALEIAREIEKELGSNISEDFIWFAINQLEKENLLNNRDKVESRFEGLSRREVIKKIGLGSMVALPIVAALVAPTSVMAQSCNPGGMGNPAGCPCTMSNQCIGMSMCVMDVCD
jgi:hypothetical protein